MADKVYGRLVKEKTVWAATQMLLRVGCEVTEIRDDDENRVTLDVFIPPDPVDPHGEALKKVVETRG